jgi:hypothetical protein
MTDKTEGNEIYKTIKATNSYDFKINWFAWRVSLWRTYRKKF